MKERFCKDFFLQPRFSAAELLSELSLEHFDTCVGQTAGRVRARAYRDWQVERELWTHRQEVGVSGDWRETKEKERQGVREKERTEVVGKGTV